MTRWLSIRAFWEVIGSHAELVDFLFLSGCPMKLSLFLFISPETKFTTQVAYIYDVLSLLDLLTSSNVCNTLSMHTITFQNTGKEPARHAIITCLCFYYWKKMSALYVVSIFAWVRLSTWDMVFIFNPNKLLLPLVLLDSRYELKIASSRKQRKILVD